MTLEELSVVFTADIAPFARGMDALQDMCFQAESMGDHLVAAFTEAGYQAARGLQKGLLSGKNQVAAAAAQVAAAATAALRGALQIHSPSRVTRDMGRMFDLGFLNGLMEDIPQVEAQSRSLGIRAANALEQTGPQTASRQRAATGEAAPIHITVPLEMDGYRLGLAVIENVNRIMNATGRVELKL